MVHESYPVDTSQLSMSTSVMVSEFVTSERIITQIKPTAPLKAALVSRRRRNHGQRRLIKPGSGSRGWLRVA